VTALERAEKAARQEALCRALPMLDAPPPAFSSVRSVSYTSPDREDRAWEILGSGIMGDELSAADALGFVRSIEDGRDCISVYWPALALDEVAA
jgi:hypothetical protein